MKSENNLEELGMSFNTLFGKVPEDWTISKIGDIAELRQGLQIASKKRLQSQELGSIPLLKITDLPRKVFSEYVKDIPVNYIATKEDIIYTRTGQVGLVYTDVEGCVHNNCFKVILDYNKFDKKYMYYYLNSPQVREYANIIASGSVQKDLTHKAFKIIKVAYPSLKEQKAIADILSSLDEKIELNNQMNETLEEMAQALFKRWFVDFEFPNEDGQPYKSSGGEMVESELGMIPKDWKIASLKDYCTEITRGQTPKYVESSELLVLNQKVNKGRILEKQYFKFLNPDLQVPQNKYCRQWDVLLNSLGQGTLGRVHLYKEKTENVVVDQHITIIRNDKFASIYLYNLLSTSQYQGRLDSLVSGSTGMLMLNISKIREMCILSPSYELVVKFGQILESTYENIATNEYINEKLVHIRDSLLPKLMSGEIRVSDFES